MTDTSPAKRKGTGLAFAYVTTLFFAWGFVTSLIGPLIAAVRRVFELSYTEATLTTFAWFIAYGIASIPAAAILGRLGYSQAIIVALVTMVAGCLLVPIATLADFYPGVLIALFVIASGVTLLQVGANPLVAALGNPKSSHARLNFSQFFNSLGTTLGPLIAAPILLTGGVFAADAIITDPATRAESLRSIDLAFLAVGLFFSQQLYGTVAPFKLDHKTAFSLLSWLVFAILLMGRARFGWRGRRAVRVIYIGSGLLLLAYVGSRFVLEVILGRVA